MEISRRIEAPPERLWQIITDTEMWPVWGPTLSEVSYEGRYIELGAKGAVKTSIGVWVPFEVTTFEPGRFWDWKVLGVKATWHKVEPVWDDAGETIVASKVTFGLPTIAAPYALVCWAALRKIDEIVSQEQRPEPLEDLAADTAQPPSRPSTHAPR